MSYADKQADRKARYEAMADSAEHQANKTHATARKMGDVIPFGQPILVGHHSEGRDRRYRARITANYEKSFALSDKAAYYRRKAASVGSAGISSDDETALDQLRDKLKNLQDSQEKMKAANKAIRAGKTDADKLANLQQIGFSEKQARELITPDFCRRVGFPSYALTNNNANIHRVEARIKELEAKQNAEDKEEAGKGYTYREDTDENRVMFIFDGKPEEQIRNILKRHAFKWSPSRGAWVRQLNANGKWAAKEARKALDALSE